MTIFDLLAEQRIADAIRRGELDGLAGAGHPLDLSEEPFVSGEQRMVNRILKNAGVTPPEVGLRRTLAELRAELAGTEDVRRREELRRRIGLLLIQLNELRRR